MTVKRVVGWLSILLVANGSLHAEERPLAAKRDYRADMRKFVQAISVEAKKANPAFLVVPQAGIALATDTGKPDGNQSPTISRRSTASARKKSSTASITRTIAKPHSSRRTISSSNSGSSRRPERRCSPSTMPTSAT